MKDNRAPRNGKLNATPTPPKCPCSNCECDQHNFVCFFDMLATYTACASSKADMWITIFQHRRFLPCVNYNFVCAHADTPAEMMLDMLGSLLEGEQPVSSREGHTNGIKIIIEFKMVPQIVFLLVHHVLQRREDCSAFVHDLMQSLLS